jgi:ribulose-5-phosphate 4-epimerase/fuculose-1-phosphate aldolase
VTFEDTKRDVAIGNRVLAHVGLCSGVTASLGHVSLRVPGAPDRFIVKGRGYAIDAIATMRAEDMIVCDLDGNKVEGPPGATQCFEVKIHSCIYKLYPEVQSVVHVHPRYAVLMSVVGPRLVPMCQEGMQLVKDPLPIYNHVKLVSSDEDGTELAALMRGKQAALLTGHGAVTTGNSISQSISTMMQLEEQARLNWWATSALGPDHAYISMDLLNETEEATPYWDLPHFANSVADDDPRRHSRLSVGGGGNAGPYKYWASLVDEGV